MTNVAPTRSSCAIIDQMHCLHRNRIHTRSLQSNARPALKHTAMCLYSCHHVALHGTIHGKGSSIIQLYNVLNLIYVCFMCYVTKNLKKHLQ